MPPTREQSLEQLLRNPLVKIALNVPNVFRRLNQAKSHNNYGLIESDPFYSSHGFRMKIMLHLSEGPRGYTGYMGIYLILVQGDHDDSLNWPFDKRVTFIVVDQQDDEGQVSNFEATLTTKGKTHFNRPSVGNTGGLGLPQFMLHSTLRQKQYVKNGSLCIAVAIDP